MSIMKIKRSDIRNEALKLGRFHIYDGEIDQKPNKILDVELKSFENEKDYIHAYENNYITRIIQENGSRESNNNFYIRKHEISIKVTEDEIIFNYE